MRKLSYPVQLLIFFRQRNLTCEHVWLHERLFRGLFSDKTRDTYAFIFEECGFELYESVATTFSTKELYEEVAAPAKRRLRMSYPLLYSALTNLRYLLGTGGLRWPLIPLLRVTGSRSGIDGGAAGCAL